MGTVLAAGRPLVLNEKVAVPAVGSYRFPEPAHVLFDIHRLGSGIEVTGSIDAVATGECDRCLADVSHPVLIEVQEQFAQSGAESPLSESNVLEGQMLDVNDLVRQLIDSSLPIALLCTDDCPGLCSTCGRPRRDAGCSCPVSVER